ncbi:unnamed protein product [Acanthosepion pharaonis]|uniref:Uncharacterized protein n=1 Tax=Acanthosepion pharaonis TaxID=158019 RepID=A0A812EVK0_ACAPH|nr:unnamed protein product [Sepia pharaonis]
MILLFIFLYSSLFMALSTSLPSLLPLFAFCLSSLSPLPSLSLSPLPSVLAFLSPLPSVLAFTLSFAFCLSFHSLLCLLSHSPLPFLLPLTLFFAVCLVCLSSLLSIVPSALFIFFSFFLSFLPFIFISCLPFHYNLLYLFLPHFFIHSPLTEFKFAIILELTDNSLTLLLPHL